MELKPLIIALLLDGITGFGQWVQSQRCDGDLIDTSTLGQSPCKSYCQGLADGSIHSVFDALVPDSETNFCCQHQNGQLGVTGTCKVFTKSDVSTAGTDFKTIIFQASYYCQPNQPVSSVVTVNTVAAQFLPYDASNNNLVDIIPIENDIFTTQCVGRQCTVHAQSCNGNSNANFQVSATGYLQVKPSWPQINPDTNQGMRDLCVKCGYQDDQYQVQNIITMVGWSCAVYLNNTFLQTYIELTHEAFIIDATTDDPIINIPAPNDMAVSLNADPPCHYQSIQMDYQSTVQYPVLYNTSTVSFQSTFDRTLGKGLFTISYIYHTLNINLGLSQTISSGNQQVQIYEPSTTLTKNNSFSSTQKRAVTRTVGALPSSKYQGFLMSFYNESLTICNSLSDYLISSSPTYIEAPSVTLTIDANNPNTPTIFASDSPESQLNITFYVFVKSCVYSNEYLRVGPLEIQSVPCNPSFAKITASTFSQTQRVISGNATAFFQFPAFSSNKPSCPITYIINQLVGASTVSSNLTYTESNGTVYLKPLNQTIGQVFENISIRAKSGGSTKKVQYSSLTITQRVCSVIDEFLNSGGNCEKCPGGKIPDGTLYGCTSPQVQATNTSVNVTAEATQEEQPPSFNMAPFFESDIEPHDTYFLDLLFLSDATDEIEITILLPKIIDADSNFQSIEVTQEVFGSVKASNMSGQFEIENEGNEFQLSFADDLAELKIKVFKAITQSYIGEQKFEIILRDDFGKQAEYDFALNFQIASQTNICIKDRRDQIEPYHIQAQYNFIEGAKYVEITICCEDGQSMTNFEALDQTVNIAKERKAYGFFLRVIEDDNFQAGFYSSKQDMEGDWVSHDDCVGTVGFKNDFDATKESQNDNNSKLTKQKDSQRDAISMKPQRFQQNGVLSLRFSEELSLIESLMPMTNISGLNSTSFESLKDINTHITELVDIKYFTNIEAEEGSDSENLKVPVLKSYSIESFNPWQVNFKLKFSNPLHVSSLPQQDHVQVVVKEPRLFKATSDGHLIQQNFQIKKVMVPPQTPSEEAYQAIQRIGSSIQSSLIVTLILPICFMLFMKVSMNRIWALFYMLQLIANLRNIKNQLTPANAQVVLDMTDNIVNFKLFQNDFVQNFLNEKVMTEKTQWIKSVMIDQGIDATNTILFVAGLGLIFAGAQVKIFQEFFEKQKKQWMWGGILRSKLSCYLPNCIIVFTQVKQLYIEASAQADNQEEDNQSLLRILQESKNDHDEESTSQFDFVKSYWRMIFILLFPAFSYLLLKRNKDQLQSKKFYQKFGILYVNLKLDKQITLTFMSIFCLRRISLALFAVFFSETLILNIYVNIFSSLAFIKLLCDTKPMDVRSINTLEIVNEMNMLYFNYSLFLYTQLVPDVEIRYAVGQVFVFLASIILFFNLSVILWSIFQEALFNHKKKKAEKAWKEFDLLKDKMARFLAVRTYQKVKKSFGEQTIDIEKQQSMIKEEMSYSQMQDKILSIFEGDKSPNEPKTSQINVFKIAFKQMAKINMNSSDTPRFRNDEANSKLNEPSNLSEDSLPSQFSVDEDKLLNEIINLEVAKFSKRAKIERKNLYQDDDFEKYHKNYQEITTEYDQKIMDLQSKARTIRQYKVQKEQMSQDINLVSILQKNDKDALIKKSQLDKRFIKTSLTIKQDSSIAQTTPKFSSVKSPKKVMLNQIKEQNSQSLRIKSRSESKTEKLETEKMESKILQEILSQGTENTSEIILEFIPSIHPWMSTNQMNSFAYKIIISKPEFEKLTDAGKQKVFRHFNAKMKLSDEDAQKLQLKIWGSSSLKKASTFKSLQKRFV